MSRFHVVVFALLVLPSAACLVEPGERARSGGCPEARCSPRTPGGLVFRTRGRAPNPETALLPIAVEGEAAILYAQPSSYFGFVGGTGRVEPGSTFEVRSQNPLLVRGTREGCSRLRVTEENDPGALLDAVTLCVAEADHVDLYVTSTLYGRVLDPLFAVGTRAVSPVAPVLRGRDGGEVLDQRLSLDVPPNLGSWIGTELVLVDVPESGVRGLARVGTREIPFEIDATTTADSLHILRPAPIDRVYKFRPGQSAELCVGAVSAGRPVLDATYVISSEGALTIEPAGAGGPCRTAFGNYVGSADITVVALGRTAVFRVLVWP